MSQIIPVTNDFRQTFTTVLNNQRVRFNIYYLADDSGLSKDGWFCNMTLLSGETQIIVTGQRLESLAPIAKNIVSQFSGRIYVVPITSPPQDLTNDSPWGITHRLIYFTEEEIDDVIALQS